MSKGMRLEKSLGLRDDPTDFTTHPTSTCAGILIVVYNDILVVVYKTV
ncbi:hypothetical protein [Corynebacterium auriscanis]|nr:hypothetical protein [Corynebacterium auriscanis]